MKTPLHTTSLVADAAMRQADALTDDLLEDLREENARLKAMLPQSHEKYVVASDVIVEQLLDQDSPPVTVRIHKQDGNRLELLFTTHICKTGAP